MQKLVFFLHHSLQNCFFLRLQSILLQWWLQGMSQRMQTRRNSSSPPSLHAQWPHPVRLRVQDGLRQGSIPLVENIPMGVLNLGIQYDTGCQLSLISQSNQLSTALPTSMYSQGTSSRVRVMTYPGEGKIILTTEVKLKLHGKTLRLSMDLVSLSQPLPSGDCSRGLQPRLTPARSPSCWGEKTIFFSPQKLNATPREWRCIRAT